MQVETELAEIALDKDTLLTIGVFDGVHIGHKYLLSRLKEKAEEQNLLPGVITFRQHPRAVLASRAELPYLTSLEEKVDLIKNEGIGLVVTLSFTRELSQLSAREFVGLLQKYLRMRGLLVGDDFVGHYLAFVQVAQSGALDGADVNEHILAAVIGLNESITFGGIEPLYGSLSHRSLP